MEKINTLKEKEKLLCKKEIPLVAHCQLPEILLHALLLGMVLESRSEHMAMQSGGFLSDFAFYES